MDLKFANPKFNSIQFIHNNIYSNIKHKPFGVKRSMGTIWNKMNKIIYALFFKKLKLCKKSIPRQYMKIFTSKVFTLGACSLLVSDLHSETKCSQFGSGCNLCAEVSSLQ